MPLGTWGDARHTGAGHPWGPGACLGEGWWRGPGRLTASTSQGAESQQLTNCKNKTSSSQRAPGEQSPTTSRREAWC